MDAEETKKEKEAQKKKEKKGIFSKWFGKKEEVDKWEVSKP